MKLITLSRAFSAGQTQENPPQRRREDGTIPGFRLPNTGGHQSKIGNRESAIRHGYQGHFLGPRSGTTLGSWRPGPNISAHNATAASSVANAKSTAACVKARSTFACAKTACTTVPPAAKPATTGPQTRQFKSPPLPCIRQRRPACDPRFRRRWHKPRQRQ